MLLRRSSGKKNRSKIAITVKDAILKVFYSPIGRMIPDKNYIMIMYRLRARKHLNLDTPMSFNEKLQWLKLYDRKPVYTSMVDKHEAKGYVKDKIGEEHIIPTLSVWESFDDIDFSKLPDQFVLKCTHDSGGLVICRDKSCLDVDEARKKINKCLKRNFYYVGREWPYKNVKPRIIAEKYMVDGQESEHDIGLTDYKFFCFNGKPKFLYVSKNLTNHTYARISFATLDWKLSPFYRNDYQPFKELPEKPKCFEEMICLAEKLSQGMKFLRVDLYEVKGKVYFSELTFCPCNGLFPFEPPEWDYKLGEMIDLDEF
ncbi:ATP-grasp fold amidoligase family protein [Vallitalea okinawensis]|uniref:ATP-grasp fold amidoligase family protein n=1 Tax=Vallitalea okinawensis TaxID=2078660 RepID=UPI000CFAC048|nr:ATP-grasp fold amidoligase family protein [Vallitalea okinawensis]